MQCPLPQGSAPLQGSASNCALYRPDINTLPAQKLVGIDLLCGGFPCQDISSAGRRLGFNGSRRPARFQTRDALILTATAFAMTFPKVQARSSLYNVMLRKAVDASIPYLWLENVAAIVGKNMVEAPRLSIGAHTPVPSHSVGQHKKQRPSAGDEACAPISASARLLGGLGHADRP